MKTVFFVHDFQESPELRKEYLESAGFRVRMLTSGHELHVALKEAQPDLVLLDVLLDGKNGFEVCQDVHLKHLYRSYPLILCSHVYRTRQFRDEAVRMGASDYLLLPMSFDDFIDRITHALASFRQVEAPSVA